MATKVTVAMVLMEAKAHQQAPEVENKLINLIVSTRMKQVVELETTTMMTIRLKATSMVDMTEKEKTDSRITFQHLQSLMATLA